jgi:hypothetical protein
VQDKACNDNGTLAARARNRHPTLRYRRSPEAGLYKTGLASSDLALGALLDGADDAGWSPSPARDGPEIRAALIRGVHLLVFVAVVGSGLALVNQWAGLWPGLGMISLIGAFQWRLSTDVVRVGFCLLTSCVLVIAMTSLHAIFWDDWRFGLFGVVVLLTGCFGLFIGQVATEIDKKRRRPLRVGR